MPGLIPRDIEFVEEASKHIVTTVDVQASPDEVWEVLADNEGWPGWFPAAKACRTTSEQRTGVGSTRWIHFDLFKVNERFVAWDRPHVWSFTILDANLPGFVSIVERAVIEPSGPGTTRLTYTIGADIKPYLAPVFPIVARRVGKAFRTGLDNLEAEVVRRRPAG